MGLHLQVMPLKMAGSPRLGHILDVNCRVAKNKFLWAGLSVTLAVSF